MASQPPHSVTELSVPNFGIQTALHQRGNIFYLVFPRAYGVLDGQKLYAQLNYSRLTESRHRFWHREGAGRDWTISFPDLMGVKPTIFRDVGVSRTVKVGSGEVEERLTEVVLDEEKFCQRCAWCGKWEQSYHWSMRFIRITDSPLFWCGVGENCQC
ncbi:hypothetical protein HBI25_038540 [Parastagonospora nodorum]|nr:hypothetical protein HBI09_063290 [Parastagonospora nodorum]KAH4907645.1 hypothetical protein HBI80_063060 [Parastagonospora nodorum]KAH4945906.1 hypothetical protein HBH74_054660 [Parastagonospora nodorum]KAH4957646.1 hypothetical protein HBH73_087230 [Parastagonospora nodorum]KAH4988848.1 hypothetical protein HBI76_085970 [Parastagonospora nodorum]